MPDKYYGELQGLHRQLNFSIAGKASLDQLQAVLNSLEEAMNKGKTFREWQKDVRVQDLGLPKHRLDNIFRTNIQAAYNRGHWEKFVEHQKTRPYLMYDAINDSRVRPSHLAMDGIIRPVGDIFWDAHYPPNGFRCRCRCISLSEKQAQERSKNGTGLNKQVTSAMNPDKGWDYNPATAHDEMLTNLVDTKISKLPVSNWFKQTLVEQKAKKLAEIQKTMTLDDIYTIAENVKPDFDSKVEQVANFLQGKAILPPLKSVERAQMKVDNYHYGDASKIRDLLRARIVFDNAEQVNTAYSVLSKRFDVVADGSRNGYATPIHSSDGYFDAKLDVAVSGIFAEIQIHTQAMVDAKERVHSLYEKKQTIQYSVPIGQKLSPEQKKEIELLNKQMRQIYKEASNE